MDTALSHATITYQNHLWLFDGGGNDDCHGSGVFAKTLDYSRVSIQQR
jgi:hypothetical protein